MLNQDDEEQIDDLISTLDAQIDNLQAADKNLTNILIMISDILSCLSEEITNLQETARELEDNQCGCYDIY